MSQRSLNVLIGVVSIVAGLFLTIATPALATDEKADWSGLSSQLCEDHKSQQPSAELWFPSPAAIPSSGLHSATLTAVNSSAQLIRANEQTLIPLPSGEWTGLTCLMGLALVRARKAIRKMLV
jgi:hypothetical protein